MSLRFHGTAMVISDYPVRKAGFVISPNGWAANRLLALLDGDLEFAADGVVGA